MNRPTDKKYCSARNTLLTMQILIAAVLLFDQVPLVITMSPEANSWAFGIGAAMILDAIRQLIKHS